MNDRHAVTLRAMANTRDNGWINSNLDHFDKIDSSRGQNSTTMRPKM